MGNYKLKNYKRFVSIYKNEQKTIKFDDTEIEKHRFLSHKSPISMKNIDINKIVVFNKVYFGKKGFKYFIGYKDAKKIDLCKFLPKMSECRRDFAIIKSNPNIKCPNIFNHNYLYIVCADNTKFFKTIKNLLES